MSVPASDVEISTFSDADTTSDLDSEWQAIGSTRGAGTDTDDIGSEVSDVDSTAFNCWEGVIGSTGITFPSFPLYPEQVPAASRASKLASSGQMSPTGLLTLAPSAHNVFATKTHSPEDVQDQTWLEQSMVGTLKGSHSLGRGLRVERRLSFPDPLSSSHEAMLRDDVKNESVLTHSSVTSSSDFTIADDPQVLGIFASLESFSFQETTSLADSLIPMERPRSPRSASPDQDSKPQAVSGYNIFTILAVLSAAIGYIISMQVTDSESAEPCAESHEVD